MKKNNFLNKLLNGAKVDWKPLGDVCGVENVGVDKKSYANEKSVRLLNFLDVFNNQYISNKTPTMVVTASDKKIRDCDIKKGDIFITPSSEKIDEIGFSSMAIEDLKNTVYSYHIMRLRIIDQDFLYPAYLNYLFKSNAVRKQIKSKAQGITRFGLTQPKWKSILIPIPPLSVQKEIVRILNTFTELTTELNIELNIELTARKKQYEYYRNTLLTFDNKSSQLTANSKQQTANSKQQTVGEIKWIELGELAVKITSGGTPNTQKKEYWENGTIPWMSSGEVNLKTIFKTEKYITELGLNNSSAKYIPKNSVVIALAGQGKTRGKVARTRIDLTTNQSLASIIFDKNVNPDYVFHFLNTQYEDLRRISSGNGTRGGLNLKMIANYKIPIPPMEEQERIVSILDKFDTLTNSITEGLPKEIELRKKQYEYYRNMLLNFPKA